MPRSKYLNGVLTVIALLLGLMALDRLVGLDRVGASAAIAQPSEQTEGAGLISAADQRKQMIVELKRIATKLEKIEGKLNSGISVKMTDMPEPKDKPAK